MSKSITAAELIEVLKKQPRDRPVFISSDPEGNGYGSLDRFCAENMEEDKLLILYPSEQYTDDDIMPVMMGRVHKETKEALGR